MSSPTWKLDSGSISAAIAISLAKSSPYYLGGPAIAWAVSRIGGKDFDTFTNALKPTIRHVSSSKSNRAAICSGFSHEYPEINPRAVSLAVSAAASATNCTCCCQYAKRIAKPVVRIRIGTNAMLIAKPTEMLPLAIGHVGKDKPSPLGQ